MKTLHIANSYLTNTILAGKVLKSGLWAAGKQDVTAEALRAVAEHTVRFGLPIVLFDEVGTPQYRATVERLGAWHGHSLPPQKDR